MNWVILLSRRKKQKALEAEPNRAAWEAVLEGHLLSMEGGREGPTEKRVMPQQAIPLAQEVAFKCLGFPPRWLGPC